MARRLEKPEAALAESDLVALADRYVREPRASPRANVDFGAGAGGQFAVAGNEIGMQMGFDYMLDAQAVPARGFQVDFDVTLRVDDRRYAFGANHIRGMRQAPEIELFKVHRSRL
jgi:hypothetical protein